MRRLVAAGFTLIVLLPSAVVAERLAVRAFGPIDGLPHHQVHTIVGDSRGFLWFGTSDGLARFDGFSFTTFSAEAGLPHRVVTSFLETRAGELWVGTMGGLVQFHPRGVGAPRPDGTPTLFERVRPDDEDPRAHAVLRVIEGHDGTIWCGTRRGLFRVVRANGTKQLEHVKIGISDTFLEAQFVRALAEDASGTLWVGTEAGLYRRWPDGRTAGYTLADGLPGTLIHDIYFDRGKRLWVAARGAGIFRLDTDASHLPPRVVEHYDHRAGLPSAWVSAMREDASGRFWLSTSRGLVEFVRSEDVHGRFRIHARGNGLVHESLSSLGEDSAGNLWMGTPTAGAMRVARHGFTSYDTRDGIVSMNEIFEDANGELYVKGSVLTDASKDDVAHQRSVEHFTARFGRLVGDRFEWFEPAAPFTMGWTLENRSVRTGDDEWWLGGGGAVYRYTPIRSFFDIRGARPLAAYSMKDGLVAPQAHRLFADSAGNVWISVISGAYGLSRWVRATNTLQNMDGTPGLPPLTSELPRAFAEDPAGGVWIGLDSGVARYRDGRFAFFDTAAGFPAGQVRAIHVDRTGRLWIGSAAGGVIRVDNLESDRPTFVATTTAQGLSSNSVVAMTEDREGRLYIGTAKGLDQWDTASGRIRTFTSDDGLAAGEILAAYCDRQGRVWIGTHTGLSRFTPPPRGGNPAPRLLVTALSVSGRPYPVSATGEAKLSLADRPASDNHLEFSFVALGAAPGERLRYQVRLGDGREWLAPTEARTQRLVGLAPGSYTIAVRVLNGTGIVSADPAVVAFRILPPIWRRPWFAVLVVVLLAAGMLAIHRYRLMRALEVERLRTRIATDLHDDIGANLTRVAILSEVARQRAGADLGQLEGPLSSIAMLSRESVSSMSDIVWAISPEHDTLAEVARKMRHHAQEVFSARDVALVLDLPDDADAMKLGIGVRRDLYLVFKEAVSNAARHSHCTRIEIMLAVAGAAIVLRVEDNGIGFDPSSDIEGHGLASMTRRARTLAAQLDVTSGSGGTRISLRVPTVAADARGHYLDA